MCTECLVVFPDGVGIIPWLVPGTNEIGVATAENEKNLVWFYGRNMVFMVLAVIWMKYLV